MVGFRWRLFSHIVSPHLNPEDLKNLDDPGLIFPVCQLFVIQHEWDQPILFAWEVSDNFLVFSSIAHWLANLLPDLAVPGSIPSLPKNHHGPTKSKD